MAVCYTFGIRLVLDISLQITPQLGHISILSML